MIPFENCEPGIFHYVGNLYMMTHSYDLTSDSSCGMIKKIAYDIGSGERFDPPANIEVCPIPFERVIHKLMVGR